MPFVHALFLIGVSAAAIPLVLHLIHTTRAPQMPFPTLRFLRLAAEKTARRRRVQNLFLLFLRMALFTLLAVALARPFLSPDLALFGGGGGQAVVILDNSMSQGVTYGGRSRMERVKSEAEALLQSDLAPPEVLLLPSDRQPSATGASAGSGGTDGNAAEFQRDLGDVIRRIRQTDVGFRRAEMARLLQEAYAAFDRSAGAERRIFLFTDLQAESWAGLADLAAVPEHPDIPICIIHAESPDASNAAVVDLQATGVDRVVGFPVPIEVTLASSPDLKGTRSLSLYVDDMNRPKERLPVEMPIERGKNDRLTFRPTFSEPGLRRLRVEIEAQDSLPQDNARRLAVDVKGGIRALIVRDGGGLAALDDPAHYLVEALAPPRSVGAAGWSIETETLAPGEVSDEVLSRTHAVLMADVAAPGEDLLGRLDRFVRRGGTLVVFAGPATVPARWTWTAADGRPAPSLLPAVLGTVRSEDRGDRGPAKVSEVLAFGDVTRGLDDLRYYQRVVVSRYVLLRPAAESRTVLKLDTGDPLLVAGRLDRGNVYLLAVPAGGDWSNFQRIGNIFLPLMLRLVHQSVARTDWPAQVVSGNALTFDYGRLLAEPFELSITDPVHTAARQQKSDPGASGVFTIRETAALGFYSAEPALSPPRPDLAWTFAVNPDGRESDLSPLKPDDLRTRLPARELYLATSVADLQRQLKSLGRTELWQQFLAMVLLLTIFEVLVSNRLRSQRQSRGVQTLVDRLRTAPGKPAAETPLP